MCVLACLNVCSFEWLHAYFTCLTAVCSPQNMSVQLCLCVSMLLAGIANYFSVYRCSPKDAQILSTNSSAFWELIALPPKVR